MMPFLEGQCEICGALVRDVTRLAGGHKTLLCLRHVNEWDEYCQLHDGFLGLLVAQEMRQIEASKPKVRQAAIATAIKYELRARATMRRVAKEWLHRTRENWTAGEKGSGSDGA
jgi:hypothetical protein